MLIFNLLSNPLLFVGYIIALLVAITIHEFAHAYLANAYGDPTAKMMGRVSLNPFVHLDLYGTIFLLLAGFGWGKPVMVNPNNCKNPKFDNLTVSLAGPISNLLLAVILGLVYRFFDLPAYLEFFIFLIIFFNLTLMIFNLIPIPPLDGSKILGIFISEESFIRFQQIGISLLFLLIIISYIYPIIPTFMMKTIGFFFTFITGKPLLL